MIIINLNLELMFILSAYMLEKLQQKWTHLLKRS